MFLLKTFPVQFKIKNAHHALITFLFFSHANGLTIMIISERFNIATKVIVSLVMNKVSLYILTIKGQQ